jgi:hypothetical protein
MEIKLSFLIFTALLISGVAILTKSIVVNNFLLGILGVVLLTIWCALNFIGIALAQNTN